VGGTNTGVAATRGQRRGELQPTVPGSASAELIDPLVKAFVAIAAGPYCPRRRRSGYYGTERGASQVWQNRATRLSLRTLLVHDVRNPADLVGPRAGMLAVGGDDTSTPVQMHQEIYDRLTGPRDLFIVDGAGHDDLYDQAPFVGQVVERAARFLGEHLH